MRDRTKRQQHENNIESKKYIIISIKRLQHCIWNWNKKSLPSMVLVIVIKLIIDINRRSHWL